MNIKTGYLYHIKDEFFSKLSNHGLMINHENGGARPTYLTIKDNDILWFIPLSSKVNKYKKIINSKMKKHGACSTILIENILGKECAILIQNAFPTIEKYVERYHLKNNLPAKVSDKTKNSIIICFKYTMELKKHGIDLFFTNIDEIKKIMESELNNIMVTS